MVPQARRPNSHRALTMREKCVRPPPRCRRSGHTTVDDTRSDPGDPHHMHHFSRKAAATAVAALALVPATALAVTIQGGPGSERLRGTNFADTIDGNAGNDLILGRGGDDRLV